RPVTRLAEFGGSKTKARSCLRRTGAYLRGSLVGTWVEVLAVAQRIHVSQHRRPGGQALRNSEIRIENIVSIRRPIDGIGAAFECSGRIRGVVETHQRSFVVQGCATPIFEEAQEITYAAIGGVGVVGVSSRPSREYQVDVFPACDC